MSTRDTMQALGVFPGQIAISWRAERNYRSLPEILPPRRSASEDDRVWPGVSVIVPARNEEANLPGLLDSLVAQDYPLYEVLVVDDASTDGTAAVVSRYAAYGVRLVESSGLPAGWTGKNHACWRGAVESQYPWLLFVDADTTLHSSAVHASLTFALKQGATALSLFPRQRCESFWERLLLPFAFQHYFVGVNPGRIHGKRGSALANGQYFLIQRAAYERAGGHAADAGSVIDDVALATRLKRVGSIPLACRGEALVTVRMYTSLPTIAEGFGKNSYLFLRQSPEAGVQTAISTALAAAFPWLLLDAWRKCSWRMCLLAVLTYLTQVMGARPWLRRFGVSTRYAWLTPGAALVFLGIALGSMLRVLTGRSLAWKGRSYSAGRGVRTRYRLPRRWIMDMGRDLLFGRPRSLVADSGLGVKALPIAPDVCGLDHIPPEGSFVLVSNHYQRLDLWIGWSGAVVIDAIAHQRDLAVRLVTTDRARIGRFTVPGTRWLIERVAAVWGLTLVTPPAVVHGRAERPRYALLRLLRLLKRDDGRAVCIYLMPEGDEGGTRGLIEAMPGTGRALYALSTRGLPLLPAAVWEAEGRLQVRFGEPFSLSSTTAVIDPTQLDACSRDTVMRHIAALLPYELRGVYGRARQP